MSRGPTWGPRTVHTDPTYYPRGAHVGPTYYSGGTHVGPMYYSGGTHVGPTILFSLFIFKKYFPSIIWQYKIYLTTSYIQK